MQSWHGTTIVSVRKNGAFRDVRTGTTAYGAGLMAHRFS